MKKIVQVAKEHFSVGNLLLVVFNGVLAVVGVLQWRIIRDQLPLMSGQLEVMRNDERAWLRVRLVGMDDPEGIKPLEVIAGQPTKVNLELMNVGKTPAQGARWDTYVEITRSTEQPHLNCLNPGSLCPHDMDSVQTLFPNTKTGETVFRKGGVYPNAVDIEVTPAEAQAWDDAHAYLAVYGMVTYFDVFQIQRWTKFCFWVPNTKWIGATYSAASCTAFNEAK